MANKQQQSSGDASPESPESETLEEAIAKLSPEQADMFMRALSLTMKKRRLMLVGNLLALFLMIAGMLWAFASYANRETGSFAAWVFLVPFGSAGFCMWIFGKLAKRAGAQTHTTLAQGPK